MRNKIRRNEIYIADLGHTLGSEQRGTRPVLIVQNDFGNKYSPTTIIVPITKRKELKPKIPTHITIQPFGNMPYTATIFAEQIKVIDKNRLKHYIDILPEKYIKQVDRALEVAIELVPVGNRKGEIWNL